jgi:hypothetical protein
MTLSAPAVGAYRVRLVGQDPRAVAQAIVTDEGETHVMLAPGRYTAFIEDLSSTRRAVEQVDVARSGPKMVTLTYGVAEEPHPRPILRPSRAVTGADAVSGLAGRAVKRTTAKAFNVGISVDTDVDHPGGWRAETPRVQVKASDEGFDLIIRRCPDWRARPKWRLTVAVEDDHAWRAPLPMFNGGLKVRIRSLIGPHGPDLVAEFHAIKPTTGVLLTSLNRMTCVEADTVLRWSVGADAVDPVHALAIKQQDPWAAATAALLLVRTTQTAPIATSVAKLARRFRWLPDLSIAAAWARAAEGGDNVGAVEEVCLQHLMTARRAGVPYFTIANALAMELLAVLKLNAKDSRVRTSAGIERSAWSRYSERALRMGPIMSWEHAGPTLRAGRLPQHSYAVVAAGAVGDAGEVTLDAT